MKEKIIHKNFLESTSHLKGSLQSSEIFHTTFQPKFFLKYWSGRTMFECAVGMFQKEVAQRISAKEGGKVYGITSVLTQAFFDIEYLFEVSEHSFQPPPKVKSAVIRLKPKNEYSAYEK